MEITLKDITMKTRRILFGLSAVALTLYTIWAIVNSTEMMENWFYSIPWRRPYSADLYWQPYNWLFLGSILFALVASLIKVKDQQPVINWHKYSTYTLTLVSLVTTIWAIVYAIQIDHLQYIYAPQWLRITGVLLGSIYLWFLAFTPNGYQLSQPLRLLIYLGVGCIGLLFLFQLASGISYIVSGRILMLQTWLVGRWLRYFLPTILLCGYSMDLLGWLPSSRFHQLRQTTNTNCPQGSVLSRLYPTMRIVAIVCMILTFVTYYCTVVWADNFLYQDYHKSVVDAAIIMSGITWLLLIFMAFFQLPNPRGYKIFNWTVIVLALLSCACSVIAIMNDCNLLFSYSVIIFQLSFFGFILITFSRVIFYSFHKDKLAGRTSPQKE